MKVRTIIAGNWKMNLTPAEAVELADSIRSSVDKMPDVVDILLCPSAVSLSSVNNCLTGSRVKLGAQNMHAEESGAFTGENSPSMLEAVGCEFVILGHSERRHVFNESDLFINRKVQTAINHQLKPILCVGETEEERNQNLTLNVIERQIKLGLLNLKEDDLLPLVIAYEPVWAIGTGKTATPELAQQVHAEIRSLMSRLYPGNGGSVPILYGGSVKPGNAESLLSERDINGALVGGASLKADSFLSIIRAGHLTKNA